MAFVDKCKIYFKAGDGGDGIIAWRREAHVPLGGPAGGDGGNGGSIIIVGDHNEHSLQNLQFIKKVIAKNGQKGAIKTMHGANAENVYVKVPLGTIITDLNTNEQLVDISFDKQEYIICQGGKGGHGNFYFKSGYNKAPNLYELGDIGQQRECQLELKQIANVGIIGLPNAGKSTFLSKVSNAKPNIANYQFTTLKPILGMVYDDNCQSYIFADIPGLIDGASKGLGLGFDFLKHIERTQVLIHLISMNEFDNENAYEAYLTIMNELKAYSPLLLNKPMIIVANKLDCDNAHKQLALLKSKLKDKDIIEISAINNDNLTQVVNLAINEVKQQQTKVVDNQVVKVIKSKRDNDDDLNLNKQVLINKADEHIWEIECEFLKYWAYKIPLTTTDNIIRFNQKMKTVQVEEQLKLLGAVKGDTIKIYNVEMEYED